jgi:molybdopterin molybdotransferase
MMSFEAAQAALLGDLVALPAEEIRLAQALGRTLAADTYSLVDLPPFDHSTMDGYALCAADLAKGPLPLHGESRTGQVPPALMGGSAMRIFTGAMVPSGANAVVMQERVATQDNRVTFPEGVQAGQNIRAQGSDLRAGALLLGAGTVLGPAQLGLLASGEHAKVLVCPKPRVAIVATGDELRDPGGGAPGTIADSNSVALAAMVTRTGGECVRALRVPDTLSLATRAITEALSEVDLLVVVGGVSVGEHDVTKAALEGAGVALDFWRVAMKPGKPMLVGRRGETRVLGLPGNPASAMVVFALFGVPYLRARAGRPAPPRLGQRALHEPLAREPGRREFFRAVVTGDQVTLVREQASGSALGMAKANALVSIAPDVSQLPAGALVDVLGYDALGLDA